MKDFQPKVAIVIPVFNGTDYLGEAVDSALAQTYRNLEVLIVNDGSEDDGATEHIALSYGRQVRYFAKPNGGVASALNLAIANMSGDYFSWLSHDDLYVTNKIEVQVDELAACAHPERTILYGDYDLFTCEGQAERPMRLKSVPPEHFRYSITANSGVHGCTLLIPKAAFDQCGLFDERLLTTQDYDLWFRFAERFSFVHVPHVLVKSRLHAQQGSVQMRDTALREGDALLAGFVSKLSAEEITSATGMPLPVAYLELSRTLRRRGFPHAARCAGQLARESGSLSLAQLWLAGRWMMRRGKGALRSGVARLGVKAGFARA